MTLTRASNNPEAVAVLDAIAAYKAAIIADPADTGGAADQLIDAIARYAVASHPAHATPSATSRFGDQHTSTAAGAKVASTDVGRFSIKSRQAGLLQAIIDNDGLTAVEATMRVLHDDVSHAAFEGCRRRVSDLLRAGYIEDSGRTRQNPGSDTDSIVWVATRAGADAYARLVTDGWSK